MSQTMIWIVLFVPMLMDTGGNSGSQASVTIIRGLSLNEIEYRDVLRVVWKEIRVAVLCGITLAIANFAKLYWFDRLVLGNADITVQVAIIVSITILVAIVLAKLVGCTLPIIAEKIGFDPAVMASPFITTIVDALSLLVFFRIAGLFLPI